MAMATATMPARKRSHGLSGFIMRRVVLPLSAACRLEHRLQRRRRLVMELPSGLQDLPRLTIESLEPLDTFVVECAHG
jgi:hypothetical protein